MYCSTCGNKVAEHLNYCNGCGARIEKNPLIVSNAASAQLARPLTIVAMMGFVGFIAVLKMVLDSGGLDMPAKVLVLVAYLITLFLVCAMMVGHMWKNSGDIRIQHHEPKEDYVSPASLRPLTTAQLEEARPPVASVTEHTTRTLDQVAVPRK
ncbi:MAG: hypothetical protein ABI878_07900 [Acidobacteriota bacterium]